MARYAGGAFCAIFPGTPHRHPQPPKAMPVSAPPCLLTLAARDDLAFVLALRQRLDAVAPRWALACGCLDPGALRALGAVAHPGLHALAATGPEPLAEAADALGAVAPGAPVLLLDARVLLPEAPGPLLAVPPGAPALLFGSGGGPVRAAFAPGPAGREALLALATGRPVPGAATAPPPAAKPWLARPGQPVDCTGARLIMQRFLVPEAVATAPLTRNLLAGPLASFARAVLGMARALRQADPDHDPAPAAPQWLGPHHALFAADTPPAGLLELPQLPLALDGVVLYLPPDMPGAGQVLAAHRAGQPWPVRPGGPSPDLGPARAALAAGDLPAALAGFDAALAANRHHREALLGLLETLAALGDDPACIAAAQHHLDSNPDDAGVAALLHAARLRDLGRETAASLRDDTGHRPGEFLVSALVSTYASEAFMEECLCDLLAQTIADRLEIIVVDAASPENEAAVVRRFQRRHHGIRYLRTPSRIGIYRAWNHAALLASGRYLTPFSTNDRLAPDAYATLAAALDAAPGVDLVFGDTRLTDVAHQTFAGHTPSAHSGGAWLWPQYSIEYNLASCTGGPHPMLRRSAIREHGLFDERLRALADQDFFLRLGRLGRVRHIPAVTGLAWLSESALSDQSRTQGELRTLRERFRAAYCAEGAALVVLNNLLAELDATIALEGREAAARLYAIHRPRLPASPLLHDLDALLG